MKMKQETREKALKARKPALVFDCAEYSIKTIPLNYEISAKVKNVKGKRLIGENFYCDLERGLEEAKGLAERSIKEARDAEISSKVKR